MARNHSGQMALYEAVNRDRFKAAQKKELARVTEAKTEKVVPVPVIIAPQQPKAAEVKQTVWKKKPGMFGLNNGKVEAYMPYPVAVTVLMALVLLLTIFYKIGHWSATSGSGEVAVKTAEKSSDAIVNLADTEKAVKEMAHVTAVPLAKHAGRITTVQATERVDERTKAGDAKGGEYVIVLAELKNGTTAKDLEPAKQYFDEHGIATEIKNVRSSFFLVTTEKYDGNFNKGTPGYTAVEKIRQVGANYKAPAGFGGFGSKPFSDAYGRKM
jgi:hypothetical protein